MAQKTILNTNRAVIKTIVREDFPSRPVVQTSRVRSLNWRLVCKIRKFRELLEKEGIPVSKILLFGSYARGTAHKDSDIDVCVVSPLFGKDRLKERRFLLHQGPKIDTRIEAVPFSVKDYKKNKISPLLHQIRKEAVEIK